VSCSAQGYTRVDGVTIANDWADLTDGSLDAAISVDELDQSVNGGAWSNTATSGTVGTRGHCQNWTNGTTGTGGIGFNTMSNTFWTDADAVIDCDTLARLYCFQQS